MERNKISTQSPDRTETMAVSAAIGKINELVSAIMANASKFESLAVDTGNKAIQLGLYLQEATGQQQLDLHLFTGLAGVTDDLSFAMAQRCVSLANRKGANYQFKSLADVQPELKLIFDGMGLTSSSTRQLAAGQPLVVDWGNWIINTFTPINTRFQEMIGEEPMEKWGVPRLDTFLAQSQFVHDEHERAKQLLINLR